MRLPLMDRLARWRPVAQLGPVREPVIREVVRTYHHEERALARLAVDRRVGQLAPVKPRAIRPDGQLAYYRARHQDFLSRHPDRSPPSYYLGYGEKYVQRFSEDLAPRLSPDGKAWLARTRSALQRAIEARRTADPAAFDRLEQDDRAFTRFAYATHVRAYLEAGFQDLSAGDFFKVVRVLDRRDAAGALASLVGVPARQLGRLMVFHRRDNPVSLWSRQRRPGGAT